MSAAQAEPPRRRLRGIVGLLAAAALLAGGWSLEQSRAGLTVQTDRVGDMPVTVFRTAASPAGDLPAPVVVIAHGFAGSQQLMQPLALSLARHGAVAVTFDFPGHGRNPSPMTGGVADADESLRVLLAAMERVTAWARPLAGPGAGYAVLGHSMASDIVVRHAQAHPEVWATVALSLFAPSIQADTPADSPRNLLVVDGAWEPSVLHDEALRVIRRVAGPAAQFGTTYGRFGDGSARRAALAAHVEHIAVLYSTDTATETMAWLDQARGLPPASNRPVAAYGPALGALMAGVLGTAWLLARLLPRVAAEGEATAANPVHRWRWRQFWPMAVMPALATPLLLWKLPSDFLPLLLGDYLALHFAVYGLLTASALWWRGGPALARVSGWALVAATAGVLAYAFVAVGVPVDRYLFNLSPTPERGLMIAALAAGTLPWFLADEALARSPRAPQLAYFATKLCFLLSLVAAIALNPGRLFFLALIVPAILLLFVVFGLFSRWVFARTRHPAPAALANALVFAWFMALTFPIVA